MIPETVRRIFSRRARRGGISVALVKNFPRLLASFSPAFAALFLLPAPVHGAWPQQYGTSDYEVGYGVAVDALGNVFSGGYALNGILGQTSLGGDDGYVAKWDAGGTLQWANLFGTIQVDHVYGLARVGAGSVVAGGVTNGALPTYTNLGSGDAMVRLYDGAGAAVWTRQYGTDAYEEVKDVAANGLGHVYAGGYTMGTFAGATAAGQEDVFVSQLDAATGAVNWTFQLGGDAGDRLEGLAADALGNVYAVGRTSGTLPGQASAGFGDAFVLKIDVSGALVWTRQFGTGFYDEAIGVAVNGVGDVLVTGQVNASLNGQTHAGGGDAYVLKLDAAGNTVWTHQFGTTTGDGGSGIAVDAAGRIVVAGYTQAPPAFPPTVSSKPDALVQVLNPDGSVASTQQFAATGPTSALDVAVDDAGTIYLAGYTSGALPGQTHQGNYDAFIIQAVPEPGSALLLALGLPVVLGRRRRG